MVCSIVTSACVAMHSYFLKDGMLMEYSVREKSSKCNCVYADMSTLTQSF